MQGTVYGGNNDGGGAKIVGQAEHEATYYENIAKGDLVTTRRYFGFDTLLPIDTPNDLPTTGQANGIAYSPDDKYLAIGWTSSPYLLIYKRNGDTFTKLANPSVLPLTSVKEVKFSPDGQYLAVQSAGGGTSNKPIGTVYKIDSATDTFTGTVLKQGQYSGEDVVWSPDSRYVIFTMTINTFIYKRSGDTFTLLSADLNLSNDIEHMSFSNDGAYLAVGHAYSPYLAIYKVNSTTDTFTKLANPSVLPSGNTSIGSIPEFNPIDNTQLVVFSGTGTTAVVYTRSGDTFTGNASAIVTIGSTDDACWSSDGVYVATVHSATSPYLSVYKRNGSTFTKLANPSVLPNGQGSAVAYAHLNAYLSVSYRTSPFLTTYKADILGDYAHKYRGMDDLYMPNYVNFGYATTAGLTGATNKKIITLPIK